MEVTHRHKLPLLVVGQSQKEVTHNEALLRLDILVGAVVQGLAATPPPEPAVGQSWIVGSAPNGAWVQHPGEIASWCEGGWIFVVPQPGFMAWHAIFGYHVVYDGSQWQMATWPTAPLQIGGKTVVSARAAAIQEPQGGDSSDEPARNAIGQILATLRDHGLIER